MKRGRIIGKRGERDGHPIEGRLPPGAEGGWTPLVVVLS